MFRQFKFEEPLYQKLDRVPMSTLFKFEAMGLQLPDVVWNQLPLEERWVFCHLPIRSRGEKECYAGYQAYILKRYGAAAPVEGNPLDKKGWEDLSRLPFEVAQKMRDLNLPLFWPEWIKLDDMERFALYKFCRENAQDILIQQVVQEFLGLSTASPAN